jgi:HEAT repeat protein
LRHCREERWTERIHHASATVLGRLGPAARDAVPTLIAAADDADAGVREAAVRALGRVGADATDAVARVAAAQVDPSASVRSAAAEALPALDRAWTDRTETATVIPVLVRRMTGQADAVCRAAREALVRVGPAAVGALSEALAAPDRVIREAAADVLGEIGAGARDAVPALTRAAEQDGSGWVREAAARAIGRITAPQP